MDRQREAALLARAADGAAILAEGLAQTAGELGDEGTRAAVHEMARDLAEIRDRLVHSARMATQPAREQAQPSQDPPPQASGLLVYDQRGLTERGKGNIKWYNPNTQLGDRTGSTRLTQKAGFCFHHTAVAGGFGTHGSRVAAWLKSGRTVSPLVTQPDGSQVITSWPRGLPASEQDYAIAMALADRYRGYPSSDTNDGTPYHMIWSPKRNVLYINLPLDWVTWHGDGANTDYIGWAWDALSTKDQLDERAAEEAIGASHEAAKIARPKWTMHCCWTNKPHDAGRDWAQMMLALAPRFNAEIDLDFKALPGAKSIRDVLR